MTKTALTTEVPKAGPVRVIGKPRFSGRGTRRVQVVWLPLHQYPAGRGWVMYSGSLATNTWHKPAPKRRAGG